MDCKIRWIGSFCVSMHWSCVLMHSNSTSSAALLLCSVVVVVFFFSSNAENKYQQNPIYVHTYAWTFSYNICTWFAATTTCLLNVQTGTREVYLYFNHPVYVLSRVFILLLRRDTVAYVMCWILLQRSSSYFVIWLFVDFTYTTFKAIYTYIICWHALRYVHNTYTVHHTPSVTTI